MRCSPAVVTVVKSQIFAKRFTQDIIDTLVVAGLLVLPVPKCRLKRQGDHRLSEESDPVAARDSELSWQAVQKVTPKVEDLEPLDDEQGNGRYPEPVVQISPELVKFRTRLTSKRQTQRRESSTSRVGGYLPPHLLD